MVTIGKRLPVKVMVHFMYIIKETLNLKDYSTSSGLGSVALSTPKPQTHNPCAKSTINQKLKQKISSRLEITGASIVKK